MGRTHTRPVLIDTDPGVDDALAIALALRSRELKVVGLTTVCGNVRVDQATSNLYRFLSLAQAKVSFPIGQGADKPLHRPLETATHVHGADGLGELDRFREANGRMRYPRVAVPSALPRAVDVWRGCLQRYPDELTLITLGPLTNLALALERDVGLVRGFRAIVAMAGAIAVPGNVTRAAEFNVYVDPDAAQRVMKANLPLTLVPLDVTQQVTMSRARIRRLTATSADPVCRFFGDATGHALDFAERVEGKAVFPFHDPLAVAAVIDPSLIECAPLHIDVETNGSVALGATVADRRARAEAVTPAVNAQVALKVHATRTLQLFEERLCRTSSS